MRRLHRFVAAGLCLVCCTGGAASAALDFPPAARGRLFMSFDLSHRTEPGATDLWIPYPLSDAQQAITNLRVEGDYVQAAVTSDRKYSTPMLHARWPEGAASRKLTLSFDVERTEVRAHDLPPVEAPWNPQDLALYLAPTSLGPTDGPVQRVAEQVTAGRSGLLEKARAVYEWTSRSTFRDPGTRGCGSGDVCKLLENPGGKCADIHSMFVAVARAAGVPAREVFGIRLGREDGQDVTTWQHCWAEFFLPGYGWVAVDPGDVRKTMLKRDLGPLDPVPEDLLAYYWGGIDPFRVKLSTGRDLVLNPPQQGAPVNYLMYPFAQIGETTLDWLDPASFTYRIAFHTL